MKTAHDQAREHGGCGEIINVDALCDGDAVPSTAGLCDSPAKHRQHVTELSTAEAAVVQRFEAGADAEESLRERLGRWLFERDYRERGLASPEDATWHEFVDRNQEEWREEGDALLAFLRSAA